jgi:hypothetical protein
LEIKLNFNASTKAIWAVAFYPFLVGTPALAQASFSNQVVTTQAAPATGCVRPLLAMADEIRNFIRKNDSALKTKE